MKAAIGMIFGASALLLSAMPAQAGVLGDDLTRCVVSSASDADRTVLVRWMFGAMSSNPAVQSFSTVTAAQRTELNRDFVTVVERLLMGDCRKQAVAAVKGEGMGVVERSFQALGEVAGRSLLASPEAAQAMSDFQSQLDKQKWTDFGAEAGVTVP